MEWTAGFFSRLGRVWCSEYWKVFPTSLSSVRYEVCAGTK